jgi:hypothetical protein
VPLPLLDNTVRAAVWFARAEAGAATAVSARAVALARGACRTMFLNKLKIAAAVLLVFALLGTGATMLLKAAPQAPDQPAAAARPQRAEASDKDANAALTYGQAFVALRRGFGDPAKLAADCVTMPLDAHARELVTKGAYALRMMRQGAALPRCDWSVPLERGVNLSFTPGDGALVLCSLACLRARMRFEEGQTAEALSDIVAGLTLARQVSREGTFDGLFGSYQSEHRLSETLALYLPKLDAAALKDLKTRLAALPAAGNAAPVALRMEESLLDWIVGEVQEAKDKDALMAFLSQLAGFKSDEAEKNRARARELLEESGGTGEGVRKFAEAMRPGAALLAKTLDLPPDQVSREFEREEKKLAGNPVYTRLFAPVLQNVRDRQARITVRRALLSAALAIQLDGESALKNHPDPVVGGAFERVAFEGGFELRSKWKRDDQPLTLTVGRRGK